MLNQPIAPQQEFMQRNPTSESNIQPTQGLMLRSNPPIQQPINPQLLQGFGMLAPPRDSLELIRHIMPLLTPDQVQHITALMQTPEEFMAANPNLAPQPQAGLIPPPTNPLPPTGPTFDPSRLAVYGQSGQGGVKPPIAPPVQAQPPQPQPQQPAAPQQPQSDPFMKPAPEQGASAMDQGFDMGLDKMMKAALAPKPQVFGSGGNAGGGGSDPMFSQ